MKIPDGKRQLGKATDLPTKLEIRCISLQSYRLIMPPIIKSVRVAIEKVEVDAIKQKSTAMVTYHPNWLYTNAKYNPSDIYETFKRLHPKVEISETDQKPT